MASLTASNDVDEEEEEEEYDDYNDEGEPFQNNDREEEWDSDEEQKRKEKDDSQPLTEADDLSAPNNLEEFFEMLWQSYRHERLPDDLEDMFYGMVENNPEEFRRLMDEHKEENNPFPPNVQEAYEELVNEQKEEEEQKKEGQATDETEAEFAQPADVRYSRYVQQVQKWVALHGNSRRDSISTPSDSVGSSSALRFDESMDDCYPIDARVWPELGATWVVNQSKTGAHDKDRTRRQIYDRVLKNYALERKVSEQDQWWALADLNERHPVAYHPTPLDYVWHGSSVSWLLSMWGLDHVFQLSPHEEYARKRWRYFDAWFVTKATTWNPQWDTKNPSVQDVITLYTEYLSRAEKRIAEVYEKSHGEDDPWNSPPWFDRCVSYAKLVPPKKAKAEKKKNNNNDDESKQGEDAKAKGPPKKKSDEPKKGKRESKKPAKGPKEEESDDEPKKGKQASKKEELQPGVDDLHGVDAAFLDRAKGFFQYAVKLRRMHITSNVTSPPRPPKALDDKDKFYDVDETEADRTTQTVVEPMVVKPTGFNKPTGRIPKMPPSVIIRRQPPVSQPKPPPVFRLELDVYATYDKPSKLREPLSISSSSPPQPGLSEPLEFTYRLFPPIRRIQVWQTDTPTSDTPLQAFTNNTTVRQWYFPEITWNSEKVFEDVRKSLAEASRVIYDNAEKVLHPDHVRYTAEYQQIHWTILRAWAMWVPLRDIDKSDEAGVGSTFQGNMLDLIAQRYRELMAVHQHVGGGVDVDDYINNARMLRFYRHWQFSATAWTRCVYAVVQTWTGHRPAGSGRTVQSYESLSHLIRLYRIGKYQLQLERFFFFEFPRLAPISLDEDGCIRARMTTDTGNRKRASAHVADMKLKIAAAAAARASAAAPPRPVAPPPELSDRIDLVFSDGITGWTPPSRAQGWPLDKLRRQDFGWIKAVIRSLDNYYTKRDIEQSIRPYPDDVYPFQKAPAELEEWQVDVHNPRLSPAAISADLVKTERQAIRETRYVREEGKLVQRDGVVVGYARKDKVVMVKETRDVIQAFIRGRQPNAHIPRSTISSTVHNLLDDLVWVRNIDVNEENSTRFRDLYWKLDADTWRQQLPELPNGTLVVNGKDTPDTLQQDVRHLRYVRNALWTKDYQEQAEARWLEWTAFAVPWWKTQARRWLNQAVSTEMQTRTWWYVPPAHCTQVPLGNDITIKKLQQVQDNVYDRRAIHWTRHLLATLEMLDVLWSSRDGRYDMVVQYTRHTFVAARGFAPLPPPETLKPAARLVDTGVLASQAKFQQAAWLALYEELCSNVDVVALRRYANWRMHVRLSQSMTLRIDRPKFEITENDDLLLRHYNADKDDDEQDETLEGDLDEMAPRPITQEEVEQLRAAGHDIRPKEAKKRKKKNDTYGLAEMKEEEAKINPAQSPMTVWWVITELEMDGRMTQFRKWADDLDVHVHVAENGHGWDGNTPQQVAAYVKRLKAYRDAYRGWLAYTASTTVDEAVQILQNDRSEPEKDRNKWMHEWWNDIPDSGKDEEETGAEDGEEIVELDDTPDSEKEEEEEGEEEEEEGGVGDGEEIVEVDDIPAEKVSSEGEDGSDEDDDYHGNTDPRVHADVTNYLSSRLDTQVHVLLGLQCVHDSAELLKPITEIIDANRQRALNQWCRQENTEAARELKAIRDTWPVGVDEFRARSAEAVEDNVLQRIAYRNFFWAFWYRLTDQRGNTVPTAQEERQIIDGQPYTEFVKAGTTMDDSVLPLQLVREDGVMYDDNSPRDEYVNDSLQQPFDEYYDSGRRLLDLPGEDGRWKDPPLDETKYKELDLDATVWSGRYYKMADEGRRFLPRIIAPLTSRADSCVVSISPDYLAPVTTLTEYTPLTIRRRDENWTAAYEAKDDQGTYLQNCISQINTALGTIIAYAQKCKTSKQLCTREVLHRWWVYHVEVLTKGLATTRSWLQPGWGQPPRYLQTPVKYRRAYAQLSLMRYAQSIVRELEYTYTHFLEWTLFSVNDFGRQEASRVQKKKGRPNPIKLTYRNIPHWAIDEEMDIERDPELMQVLAQRKRVVAQRSGRLIQAARAWTETLNTVVVDRGVPPVEPDDPDILQTMNDGEESESESKEEAPPQDGENNTRDIIAHEEQDEEPEEEEEEEVPPQSDDDTAREDVSTQDGQPMQQEEDEDEVTELLRPATEFVQNTAQEDVSMQDGQPMQQEEDEDEVTEIPRRTTEFVQLGTSAVPVSNWTQMTEHLHQGQRQQLSVANNKKRQPLDDDDDDDDVQEIHAPVKRSKQLAPLLMAGFPSESQQQQRGWHGQLYCRVALFNHSKEFVGVQRLANLYETYIRRAYQQNDDHNAEWSDRLQWITNKLQRLRVMESSMLDWMLTVSEAGSSEEAIAKHQAFLQYAHDFNNYERWVSELYQHRAKHRHHLHHILSKPWPKSCGVMSIQQERSQMQVVLGQLNSSDDDTQQEFALNGRLFSDVKRAPLLDVVHDIGDLLGGLDKQLSELDVTLMPGVYAASVNTEFYHEVPSSEHNPSRTFPYGHSHHHHRPTANDHETPFNIDTGVLMGSVAEVHTHITRRVQQLADRLHEDNDQGVYVEGWYQRAAYTLGNMYTSMVHAIQDKLDEHSTDVQPPAMSE